VSPLSASDLLLIQSFDQSCVLFDGCRRPGAMPDCRPSAGETYGGGALAPETEISITVTADGTELALSRVCVAGLTCGL